jgi:predicted secreted hydrolase
MRKKRKNKHKFRSRRFSLRTYFILSILLITTCGIAAWAFYKALYNEVADDWFDTSAIDSVSIFLPKDDGPHQAAVEWWKFNGFLRTESGDFFSFYYNVSLANDLVSHMVSHASFNNHQTGKHHTAQRKTVKPLMNNTENRFELIQGDWLMVGGNGNDRLRVVSDEYSFDLNLVATQEPTFHGGNGIILSDISGDSYYYSRTRMATSGTITIGEITERIKGISWFDHQWGDFSVGLFSKDWFGLQLEDGTDVMIYQLRDKSHRNILKTGSIRQNGITKTLLDTDFTLVPTEQWTSSNSHITYPIEWTIDIPTKNISVTVQSVHENSEFDATLTSYNIYWKGPVKIRGSHTGLGFMELNYLNKEN